MTPRPPSRRSASSGFTLLEVMAVVVLTGLVLFVAIDFYMNLSDESNAAADHTRQVRRTVVLLDRISRDFQATVLLEKPPSEDPLAFPWVFYAEADDPHAGADRIKFVTRGHRPRGADVPSSDLEMVAWMLRDDGHGGHELVRWSSPQLPDRLDRSFPPTSADGSEVVADGIASFGVEFLDDQGNWDPEWDSSSVADAGKLPRAVRISLAFAPEPTPGAPSRAALADAMPPTPYEREVLLPLRPLDLYALMNPGQSSSGTKNGQDQNAGDEQGANNSSNNPPQCVTVSECLAKNPQAASMVQAAGIDPSVLQSIGNQCFSNYAGLLGVPIQGCQ